MSTKKDRRQDSVQQSEPKPPPAPQHSHPENKPGSQHHQHHHHHPEGSRSGSQRGSRPTSVKESHKGSPRNSYRDSPRSSTRNSQTRDDGDLPSHSSHDGNTSPLQARSSTRGSKKGVSKSSSRRSSRRSKGRAMPLRQKSYSYRTAAWLEPRVLLIATCITMLGVLLHIIAISTNSWLILENPVDLSRNQSETLLLEAYTGLWKLCKVELRRAFDAQGKLRDTRQESCEPHNLFPTEKDIEENQDYDNSYLDFDVKDIIQIDYTRTAIAFTIIALCIMALGHGFAFYSLRRPRYIIKRLTALLHFMTAACLLVLNEVFVKTVEHERDNIPDKAIAHYGYSFVLSWLVFVCFLLAGLAFLFMSHKKKAEYAGDNVALEDEPMEIRR